MGRGSSPAGGERAHEVGTSPPVELSGWGRFPRSRCRVVPAAPDAFEAWRSDPTSPPAIVRGAGRSYGDAALCSRGVVFQVPRGGTLEIDASERVLRADAGVTVEIAQRAALERGLSLPVLPGTGAVTLGGAAAADIHGKNHHREGSFGHHVRALDLVPARGKPRTLSADAPDDANRALLSATLGGMGLTGWIRRIELSLTAVPSAWIRVQECATRSLPETIDILRRFEERSSFTVAWLDGLAPGDRLGRGLVSGGESAEPSELPSAAREQPYVTPPRTVLPFPPGGEGMVFRAGVRVFNSLRHRAGRYGGALRRTGEHCVPWDRFFFPLDALSNWNRLYGTRGFRQHQCLLPFDVADEGIRSILTRLTSAGHPPYLAVLKGFGRGRGGLSFPRPGLTLALDLPRRPGLAAVLDDIDREVADRGGRIYLAKDAAMRPDVFARTAPEVEQFRARLTELDPAGRISSDLSARLAIR